MQTLNLTQHQATPEQKAAGVVDLKPELREELKELLTFYNTPSADDIEQTCEGIYEIVKKQLEIPFDVEDEDEAIRGLGISFMIGGAPFLMGPLSQYLIYAGTVLFAFSKRVSEEDPETGKKVSYFRHEGFVEAVI